MRHSIYIIMHWSRMQTTATYVMTLVSFTKDWGSILTLSIRISI